MILARKTVRNIEQEIDKRYAMLALILLGVGALSDDEQSLLGPVVLAAAAMPLIEHIYAVARKNGGNTLRSPALTQGRQEFKEVINNVRDDVKKRIRGYIIATNDQARRDAMLGQIQPNSAYMSTLTEQLTVTTRLLADSAVRVLTVAMTNLVNNAAAEGASQEASAAGIDALVYKIVQNDGRLCAWCARFYKGEDGQPIVYKLKDLVANGTNEGKPKSEWKPVVGSTHPRCRCELFYKRS